jgi:hypothetical protein
MTLIWSNDKTSSPCVLLGIETYSISFLFILLHDY